MAARPGSMDAHSGAPNDGRLVAAAAERNKDPILRAVTPLLAGKAGCVLELAAGTGQHAAHLVAAFPSLSWLPTDASDDAFASIRAWTAGLANALPPVVLDATADAAAWPKPPTAGDSGFVAVYVANMTHIAPWGATLGLMRGAGTVLRGDGVLILYGPFAVDGAPATESDARFDASLRAQNPEWGYRDVREVATAAAREGLALTRTIPMPANNFILAFERSARGGKASTSAAL